MLAKIVYVLGILAAIWCVLDILKRPWGFFKKLLICILVLAFSWVGCLAYFLFKDKL